MPPGLRLPGFDVEERSADVRALHALMRRSADRPSTEATAALFQALAGAQLWAPAVGHVPSAEQGAAQARLSGHVEMSFRAGRTPDGETYLPAATTHHRLEASGFLVRGDTAIRVPLSFLAVAARSAAVDSLVINPGSVPFGRLTRTVVSAFADGTVPDAREPDTVVRAARSQMGEVLLLEHAQIPERVVEAATNLVRAERIIAAAGLAVRMMATSRVYLLLIAINTAIEPAALAALVERMSRYLATAISADEYVRVEPVTTDDPRLADTPRVMRIR